MPTPSRGRHQPLHQCGSLAGSSQQGSDHVAEDLKNRLECLVHDT